VTRRFISTRPIETGETAHLTELLYDDGENEDTLVCAGHGGAVEPGTAELALELATNSAASCWATLGYESDGSAFDRFHPPSTAIGADRYPLFGEIADRAFDRVLSVHGLADDEVLVGGAIDEGTKRRAVDHLDGALSVPVTTASDAAYAGTHPENFVNSLAAAGGLQIELGPTARGQEAAATRAALLELLDSEW
jgi:phage replication-related protein YjqB (UPF0714/DUF867 family)